MLQAKDHFLAINKIAFKKMNKILKRFNQSLWSFSYTILVPRIIGNVNWINEMTTHKHSKMWKTLRRLSHVSKKKKSLSKMSQRVYKILENVLHHKCTESASQLVEIFNHLTRLILTTNQWDRKCCPHWQIKRKKTSEISGL